MPDLAVSVVVPTRGGAARLPTLLDALATQVLDEAWEVVLVLDGDVDGSRALIEEYADRIPLRVVETDGATGVAAALATGYREAAGEIVLRCDDDLTPPPGFLAGHLRHHRSRPAGAPPLGVISLTRDVFPDTPYAAAYGRPANERLLAAAYARSADERWRHWAACNSVPKAAYDAVGGFDTTMGYREDSELGLRLARSGVEIVIDRALEVEHRGPATDTATRAARAFTSGASALDFEARHPGTHPTTATARDPWNRAVGCRRRPDRLTDRCSRARGAASTPLCPGCRGGCAARRSPGPSRRPRWPVDAWATPTWVRDAPRGRRLGERGGAAPRRPRSHPRPPRPARCPDPSRCR